jgi:type IV pilus assembly protein PilO
MNVLDELRNLDTNDVGRWPLPFRVGAIVIVFVAVAVFGIYMTVVKNKVPMLERAESRERELRQTFENKQKKAANFDAYRAQLAQMEQSFGTICHP